MSDELSELRALSLKLEIDAGLPLETLRKSGDAWVWTWRAGSDAEACDTAAEAIVAAWPLNAARAAAADRVKAGYAAAVAGGYAPAGYSWTISADAQADITGIATRIVVRQLASTDTVKLPTSAGAVTLTVANASPIIFGYDDWLTPKREQLSQKTADAATASTTEAANAIVWS